MKSQLKSTFRKLLNKGLPSKLSDVTDPPVAEMGKLHFSYPSCRLVFGLSGIAEYWTLRNGEYHNFTLNAGEAVMIHSGALFRSRNNFPYETCGFLVRESNVDIFINDMEHRHFHREMLNVRLSDDTLFTTLEEIAGSDRPVQKRIKALLALEEICTILENPAVVSGSYGKFLQLRAYLHKHWQLKLNRRDLAETFDLNENYLNSLFQRFSGCSYSDYLDSLRLNHVRDLLESRLPIKEIADLCGYYHPSYMIRRFKRKFGSTPLQYRKSLFLKD